MEKLWTISEVARALGINDVDVEELVRQGRLTGYQLGGQFLRFRPSEVEALKGKLKFRPNKAKRATARRDPWFSTLKDFVYFYDFYILSATFLAALVIYLIASG
jgi:excisionase family DNA binding protein